MTLSQVRNLIGASSPVSYFSRPDSYFGPEAPSSSFVAQCSVFLRKAASYTNFSINWCSYVSFTNRAKTDVWIPGISVLLVAEALILGYISTDDRQQQQVETMGDSDSDSSNSGSSDGGKDLTLSEAKGILRDIMTLCERQPHRKKLVEARAKAKGNPRTAMLSVVPMVVGVAEGVLAKRHENKRSTRALNSPASTHATAQLPGRLEESSKSGTLDSPGNITGTLVAFLLEAQFLMGSDSSGGMKRDMMALRSLLSPP